MTWEPTRYNRRVSGRSSPVALAKLIRARAEQLSEPPTLFRKGRGRGTGEMVVHPNYFMVYRMRARAKRVEILRVLHAARQWPPSS